MQVIQYVSITIIRKLFIVLRFKHCGAVLDALDSVQNCDSLLDERVTLFDNFAHLDAFSRTYRIPI